MVVITSCCFWSSSLKLSQAFQGSASAPASRRCSASVCRPLLQAKRRPPAHKQHQLQSQHQHLNFSCIHKSQTRRSSSQFRRRSQLVCSASAAGAAALPASSADGVYGRAANPDPGPRSLPPPPKGSGLLQVLPYLARLAATDPQLYWRLGVASVLLIISKAAGLIAPFYFKAAIDCLGDGASKAAIGAATAALLWSGLCRVINGIAKEVQHPVFTPVSQAAGRRVAYHTFSHVLDLDLAFHLERRTGTLTRILERGTRAVAMVFRAVVFTFIPTIVELVLVCGLLARTFRPLVSIMVVATFVAYVAWTLYMTAAATEARKQVLKLDNLYTNKAVDALLNYETVKLFNNEALEVSQYDEYLVGYQKASVENEKIYAALNGGQSVILAMGLTSILIAAATSAGNFTAGDLVMAQGLLLQLWGPLSFLGWFYRELRQSLVDMEAFFGILSQTTNLPDGSRPLPASSDVPASASSSPSWDGHHITAHQRHQQSHAAARGMSPSSGNGLTPSAASSKGLRVELKDVKFAYNSGREVLKGINLTIEPGQSIAFVGGSGSGKSTVLKLLMRLYDVSSGTVHVNGVDVRDLKQSSYRSAVAVVPQDTVLFNDTILRNVAYGRPQASNDEIVQAAEMARLGESIGRMPEGYNTMAGERGLKLSGGEKSRVAIARAFLRNPRLLICDEATAALDTVTEQAIMRSLNELAEGRTCVFVAHRLSTIQGCDKIVVMSEGHVAEVGSHEELMAAGHMYYSMWESQAAADANAEKCVPQELAGLPVDQ